MMMQYIILLQYIVFVKYILKYNWNKYDKLIIFWFFTMNLSFSTGCVMHKAGFFTPKPMGAAVATVPKSPKRSLKTHEQQHLRSILPKL